MHRSPCTHILQQKRTHTHTHTHNYTSTSVHSKQNLALGVRGPALTLGDVAFVDRPIKRCVERVERRSVHQRGGRWAERASEKKSQLQCHTTRNDVSSHAHAAMYHELGEARGRSNGRDGVVWPWCKTAKANGGSARRSPNTPPARRAQYGRKQVLLTACLLGRH
jgi:hypothetical protein